MRHRLISMTSEHGTYSVSDGTRVDFADAMDRWVPLAHEILVQTAKTYNATTTYKQLTEAVQEARASARELITHWIGKLLERVARRVEGQPPLTSSASIRTERSAGYFQAPRAVADTPTPTSRNSPPSTGSCYQRYARTCPRGGAPPSPRRSRGAIPPSTPTARPATCPIHYVELSATGVCSDCD